MDKPAFPSVISDGGDMGLHPDIVGGLTRRELFAAMAMQAMATQAIEQGTKAGEKNDVIRLAIVKASVVLADALIAELEKSDAD